MLAATGEAAEAIPAPEHLSGPQPKPAVVADLPPLLLVPEPLDATPPPEESDQGQPSRPSSDTEIATLDSEHDEAHFKWLRETHDADQLQTEMRELEMQISEMCKKMFMQRLDEGEYEKMADRTIMLDDDRRHLIETYTDDADGNPVRITLPAAKYPEPYKLKRKALWLLDLLNERR